MKHLLVRIGRKAKNLINKGQPIVVATAMAVSVVLSCMPAMHSNAAAVQNLKATPRVSFTFDDGLGSALSQAAPTLAAHGLTGTDYVITNCVGTSGSCLADPAATYMTWDQIAQLKAYNWEIASHTKTHIQLSTDKPSATELTSQLADSQAALKAHGYDTADLAFPYGDYDNNVLAQTAKYYESARGFADLGYNTYPYDGTLIVNQQIQEGTNVGDITGVTFAQVKAYIDAAITNKQWLVLTFHDVIATKPANLKADAYATSTALLDQIATYVKQQQDAGAIRATNVEDGLVRGTNMLPNGDFAAGIANGWTTDDAAYITADANNNGRYPEPTHAISLKSNPAVNAGSRDGESHLFSPKVGVAFGKTYILKNYLNMLAGGSVSFYVDEYDAAGTWISGKDPLSSRTYSATANAINVADTNFSYTPTSAAVASASLQVIVRHATGVQAYLDGSQWLDTDEVTGTTPPVTDTTAPVVSNVTIVSTTANSATISWTTDEPSTAVLNYGTTPVYGQVFNETTLGTTHTATLTGLTASTNYQFQIIAKDAAGNIPATPTASSFGTLAAGAPVVGDLAGNDGKVTDADLSVLLFNWYTTGKTGLTAAQGDLAGNDGIVNDSDLSVLLYNWTKEN